MTSQWAEIEHAIAVATGQTFNSGSQQPMSGGCINSAYRLIANGHSYFVKLNDPARIEMFAAEVDGLRELAATQTVRVPGPVCHGVAGDVAFLVLEYIDLRSGGSGSLDALGESLAAMHRIPQPYFGWRRDNTIGSTAQINTPAEDWVDFWRGQRLGFQLDLAAKNGFGGHLQRDGERLMADLDVLFAGYAAQPSLLHGDLWGGNYATAPGGEPVIFDPAVYYGDREADLAMTELFGGFGSRFRAAYEQAYPVDPGYSVRKVLYNLYHILNHLNLFGGGYLSQAHNMAGRLLSELR